MPKYTVHEVALPLQLDMDDWSSPHAVNDPNYRVYTRHFDPYVRTARVQHECDWCIEPIRPGDWYEGCVTLNHPGKLVCPTKKWRVRITVEKRHYPECPEHEREMEDEMHRAWEKEDKEVAAAADKVA